MKRAVEGLTVRRRHAVQSHGHDATAARARPTIEGRECHHCKQWIEPGETHDCWTTTEAALTEDLSEELRDAWDRLRETAAAFGPQRIYASGTAIMFSRDSCYFFVRPRRSHLQVCMFLGRAVRAPQIRRVERTSKTKLANIVHVTHRDEVEPPLTDWLLEAYELPDQLTVRARKTTRRGAASDAPRRMSAKVR
jgi:Domain of unknown function (DUF5655)